MDNTQTNRTFSANQSNTIPTAMGKSLFTPPTAPILQPPTTPNMTPPSPIPSQITYPATQTNNTVSSNLFVTDENTLWDMCNYLVNPDTKDNRNNYYLRAFINKNNNTLNELKNKVLNEANKYRYTFYENDFWNFLKDGNNLNNPILHGNYYFYCRSTTRPIIVQKSNNTFYLLQDNKQSNINPEKLSSECYGSVAFEIRFYKDQQNGNKINTRFELIALCPCKFNDITLTGDNALNKAYEIFNQKK